MNIFRNVLLGTAAVGMTVMAMNPANAAETKKTLKVSGFISRVVAVTDDGDTSYVDYANAKMIGSRFRIVGESKGANLTIGARMEFGLTRDQAQDQTQNGTNSTSNGLQYRNSFIYFKSKRYGTLALGLQSTATDGTAEIDLSGTKAASYNTNVFPNSKYYFLQTGQKGGTTAGSTTATADNPRIDSVFNGFDGNSRRDAIRYTSPSLMGFKIDVSAEEGGNAEGALKYGGKFYNTKVAAAIGYTSLEGTTSKGNTYVGTISALHSSGVSATVSYGGKEKSGRNNATNLFVKLGYQLKVFGVGKTSMSVSYQRTNDNAAASDRAKKWGVEAVQKLDGYSTELIAAYTKMSFDRPSTNYNDIDAGWLGARVKF